MYRYIEDRYVDIINTESFNVSKVDISKLSMFRDIEPIDISKYWTVPFIEISNSSIYIELSIYRNVELFDICRTVHISKYRILRYIEVSNYRDIEISRYRLFDVLCRTCFALQAIPRRPRVLFYWTKVQWFDFRNLVVFLLHTDILTPAKTLASDCFLSRRFSCALSTAGRIDFVLYLFWIVDCWLRCFCFCRTSQRSSRIE